MSEGAIVALRSDFNPNSIAWLMALIQKNCIVVPISLAVFTVQEFYEIADVDLAIDLTGNEVAKEKFTREQHHEFYQCLQNDKQPGLVLFFLRVYRNSESCST